MFASISIFIASFTAIAIISDFLVLIICTWNLVQNVTESSRILLLSLCCFAIVKTCAYVWNYFVKRQLKIKLYLRDTYLATSSEVNAVMLAVAALVVYVIHAYVTSDIYVIVCVWTLLTVAEIIANIWIFRFYVTCDETTHAVWYFLLKLVGLEKYTYSNS